MSIIITMVVVIIISSSINSITTTIIMMMMKQAEECDMFNQLMESGYGTAEEVLLYIMYIVTLCIIVHYAIVHYVYF